MKQMDTTKEGIKAYLVAAGNDLKVEWHSQAAHRLAVLRYILDSAEITGEKRKAVAKEFLATPKSFGANCSAMAQQLGRKPLTPTEALKEFEV